MKNTSDPGEVAGLFTYGTQTANRWDRCVHSALLDTWYVIAVSSRSNLAENRLWTLGNTAAIGQGDTQPVSSIADDHIHEKDRRHNWS